MRKGIVMEINERFLTLLTPEGEFIKVSKTEQSYELGQEIFIPVQEKEKALVRSFLQIVAGKSMVAFAIVCIIAIFSFTSFYQSEVYAYMSIDVNPSIELGVDKNLKVVEITPYNESGKQVVAELDDWKNIDLQVVSIMIIDIIKGNGYLEQQKEIVISKVHSGKSIQETELRLEETIVEIEEKLGEDDAKVISVEGTKQDRDLAVESGVTVGKLVSEQKKATKESKIEPKEDKVREGNYQRNSSINKPKENSPSSRAPGQLKKELKEKDIKNKEKGNGQKNKVEKKEKLPPPKANSGNKGQKKNGNKGNNNSKGKNQQNNKVNPN